MVSDIDSELYGQLSELPETLIGEIVEGALVSRRFPLPLHSIALSSIEHDISRWYNHNRADRLGDWWILKRIECHLGRDVLVPDIAGWRVETIPDMLEFEHVNVVPAWVCEFASTATKKHILTTKRNLYARLGVQHLWIAYPEDSLIEVFSLSNRHWILIKTVSAIEITSLPPFDRFSIDFRRIWTD